MTIAHDSEVLGAANTAAGNYDTAITPTNPPDGACVIIVGNSNVDLVTSASYGTAAGAVLLTRRRFNVEISEIGAVYIYWGTGLPTGTQTIRIVRTGSVSLRAAISTMTVAAGMAVAIDTDATGGPGPVANPSWAMTTTDPTTQCYLGIHSGLQAMTNTPASNWTLAPTPGFEDYGSQGRGWARRAATSAANQLPGWASGTSEDFVGASIAFKEIPLAVESASRQPHIHRRAVHRAAIW
jgi:hypothetical protein